MPGTGKSTIARTAFEHWTEHRGIGRLCASFTFERGVVDDAQHLFTTLALRLACDQRLRHHISEASGKDRNVSKTALRNQFMMLLHSPIMKARQNGFEEPIYLFLDALDQCSDTSQLRRIFEITISQEARQARIRFIIASRPEEPLHSLLDTRSQCVKRDLDYRDKRVVKADLTLFHKAQMPYLEGDDLEFLVKEAEGSFVFAAQTCLVLDASRSSLLKPDLVLTRRGSGVSGSTTLTPLDKMDAIYEEVLSTCLSQLNNQDRRVWIQMLHHFIAAAETHGKVGASCDYWSFINTAGYGGIDSLNTHRFRKSIGSLVRFFSNERVDFIHSSFSTYLRDKLRSSPEELWMDSPQIHKFFVRTSASLIQDASQLQVSQQVPLQRRHINRRTRYACMQWVSHLCLTQDREHKIRRLRELATSQANSLLYSTSVILLLEGREACKDYFTRLNDVVNTQLKASEGSVVSHSHTKEPPKDSDADLNCLLNSLLDMHRTLDLYHDRIEESPSEFWKLYYRLPTDPTEVECNHRTCIARARWDPLRGTQARVDRPLQLRPPERTTRLSASSLEGSESGSEMSTRRTRRFSGRIIPATAHCESWLNELSGTSADRRQ
ncbi:uncharacterized protein EKO05_0004647 [Ascochyta rabiei]|uniref:uncharacterized protein n=1 Tax=Didymella rabiei TaxID=5454 RepID=UPI00220D6998|nr:uncharacterized protein EKO05_0004647 [Ascochyta rabiei]UPX14157.1 hypothetical protein EKO05_0004647 [Ascochyta rabiei]